MTEVSLLGRRVLVVEDEPLIAMLIDDLLSDVGCTVIGPAAEVKHALQLLERNTVDLAILDVNLNGDDSYPVADELTRRGVPFVFASGHGSNGLIDKYQHHLTLSKPFQEEDLTMVLAQAFLPIKS